MIDQQRLGQVAGVRHAHWPHHNAEMMFCEGSYLTHDVSASVNHACWPHNNATMDFEHLIRRHIDQVLSMYNDLWPVVTATP